MLTESQRKDIDDKVAVLIDQTDLLLASLSEAQPEGLEGLSAAQVVARDLLVLGYGFHLLTKFNIQNIIMLSDILKQVEPHGPLEFETGDEILGLFARWRKQGRFSLNRMMHIPHTLAMAREGDNNKELLGAYHHIARSFIALLVYVIRADGKITNKERKVLERIHKLLFKVWPNLPAARLRKRVMAPSKLPDASSRGGGPETAQALPNNDATKGEKNSERQGEMGQRGPKNQALLDQISELLAELCNQIEKDGATAKDRSSVAQSPEARPSKTSDNNSDDELAPSPHSESQSESESVHGDRQAIEKHLSGGAEKFRLADIRQALQDMVDSIGMVPVKREVLAILHRIAAHSRGDKFPALSGYDLHMAFLGDPGTGKRRIVGILTRLYFGFGLLNPSLKAHQINTMGKDRHQDLDAPGLQPFDPNQATAEHMLTETDFSGLVGGYPGETALQTKALMGASAGGVLYIKEAHALTEQRLVGDRFGREAVATLLDGIDEHRDELIVILAGNAGPMLKLVNSYGIRTQFQKLIAFANYTAAELFQAFQTMCHQHQLQIPPQTKEKIVGLFTQRIQKKSDPLTNFHLARQLFEEVSARQAGRVYRSELTDSEQKTILPVDLPPN